MHINNIGMVKAQLQRCDTEKNPEALVRSRTQCFLHGEQPTRRSLDDERRYAMSKKIVELVVGSAS